MSIRQYGYDVPTIAAGVDMNGMKRIAVSFDPEVFAMVFTKARGRGTSFAKEVRRLVEIALELEEQ